MRCLLDQPAVADAIADLSVHIGEQIEGLEATIAQPMAPAEDLERLNAAMITLKDAWPRAPRSAHQCGPRGRRSRQQPQVGRAGSAQPAVLGKLGINPRQDIRDVLEIDGSRRLLAQVNKDTPAPPSSDPQGRDRRERGVGSAVQDSDDSTHGLHPFQRYFGPRPNPLAIADVN